MMAPPFSWRYVHVVLQGPLGHAQRPCERGERGEKESTLAFGPGFVFRVIFVVFFGVVVLIFFVLVHGLFQLRTIT